MKKNELNHVALIMDGNGRWATNRLQPRTFGHKKGASIIQDITKEAIENNVKYITFYAFSTENWNRPSSEVDYLMKLLSTYLESEGEFYEKNNIKFNVIGDISKLSQQLQKQIKSSMDNTKDNSNIVQSIAINYGSQDEITNSLQILQKNNIPITKENIQKNLYTKDIPPVDVLIRTGGHKRLSNYLLWQIAYAVLFFIDTLWPDFTKKELNEIFERFYKIKRNFGGL